MRISDWAQKFNLAVKRCEERPDHPQGEIVYRVKEVFTTLLGSWDPSSDYGAIPQWARDAYLKPWGAQDYLRRGGRRPQPVRPRARSGWQAGQNRHPVRLLVGWVRQAGRCRLHRLHCGLTPKPRFRLGKQRCLEQLQPRKRRARRMVLVPRRRGRCRCGRRDAQQPSRFHLRRLAGRAPRGRTTRPHADTHADTHPHSHSVA